MIHKEIREYIKANKLSQKEISLKTRLSEAAMCELLNGRRKIEVNEYLAICQALNVHYSFFIDERNNSDSANETA